MTTGDIQTRVGKAAHGNAKHFCDMRERERMEKDLSVNVAMWRSR